MNESSDQTNQEPQGLHGQSSIRRFCHWVCCQQPSHYHLSPPSCPREVRRIDSQLLHIALCNPATITLSILCDQSRVHETNQGLVIRKPKLDKYFMSLTNFSFKCSSKHK